METNDTASVSRDTDAVPEQNMKRGTLLVLALASGKSYSEAAQEAGVGKSTVIRRMRRPDFRRRVFDVRSRIVDEATSKLAAGSVDAVRTLIELLNDDNHVVRLGAAKAILDQLSRYREITELEQRIAELEQLRGR